MQNCLIIAEAGVNHNGSLEIAKRLIEIAADAGVDVVKFQTFKASNIVSSIAKKADYQKGNMKYDTNDLQFSMLKKLELTYSDHLILIEHCKKHNINFLSTAFDLESIDMLVGFGLEQYKIPSGEITNLPYLQKIGKLKKEIIISTGMSTLEEVEDAISVLMENGTERKKITVLHCNTEYPTPMQDVNLRAMLTLKQRLDIKIGYSDHTLGIEVPVAAVALGAQIIEKHFTLDRNMEGPDHLASLEPDELKAMVKAIRNIELALSGNGEKEPSSSEIKNKTIARKSIHLKSSLPAGHIITQQDLEMKRPGDGISPMQINEVIGRTIKEQLPQEHKLSFKNLK
jgi:N,N'-diacetyllegionaminate synthase